MPHHTLAGCSFLPVLAADTVWSLHTHPAFPPAFHGAVRVLLLINSCCGFGGSGPAEPAEPSISLPTDVLHTILRWAARPLAAWVPLVQKGFQQLAGSS